MLGVWAFSEADTQDAARLQTAPTASPAPVQSVQLGRIDIHPTHQGIDAR